MYCARPFEQFYVTEDGDVHLCCPEWIAMPAGNLLARPPRDVWRGKVAENIRKSILDQSFRHCVGCPFLPGPAGCVIDEPPGTPRTDRIKTLTVAYDPACNLQCPSCRTCRKHESERASLIQEILLDSGIFDEVDQVNASGSGDPFASHLFWTLLERLPPQKYPHLRLAIQTNGLLLTERTWGRLGEYANRIDMILVSVDAATAETYHTNRGGDFSALTAVLEEIVRRDIPLQLNFVVQANNYREMIPFVHLAEKLGAKRTYFSALDNWGTYDEKDYRERSVHLTSHPDHSELLKILRSPVLQDGRRVTLARLPKPKGNDE